MTNLEKKLKEFEKTTHFKELVAAKMKTNASFGSASGGYGSHKTAMRLGKRMQEILRNEILSIQGKYSKDSFLDHIVISEKFITGIGWIVDVSFDEDEVTRNSLYWQNPEYEMGAYLPVLFNEGYDADNYVYGYNNNGQHIRSLTHRDALHFIQQAVEKFNAEKKGLAVAQYSGKYSGGTF